MKHASTVRGLEPAPGHEDAPAPQPVDPATGQAGDHWVLSPAERASGYVRPVRDSYKHVGRPGPKHRLRDLTDDERALWSDSGFVKFEEYPESERPTTGRFWTQPELDSINKGCGTITNMPRSIAETYAKQPGFYGSTFCCGCSDYIRVGRNGEFVWLDDGTRVGT